MEGLELVGRDRGLVLVKVSERVLGAVVMSIIVSVDGLRLETGNGIELLDGSSTKTCQRTEHGTLVCQFPLSQLDGDSWGGRSDLELGTILAH